MVEQKMWSQHGRTQFRNTAELKKYVTNDLRPQYEKRYFVRIK